MKERRGLFEAIFGKKQQSESGYADYRLLNSYQTNFVPFSGNAWEVNTVRAAIHSFARRAATVQPRHIRRGDGKLQDVENSSYNYILQYQPNPLTTAYKFYYRAAAQYKLYNNAFIFPVWNEITGKLEAMYNINAQEIKLLDHNGELHLKFRFQNGKTYIFPYTEIIHIGSMFADNEIFGSSNEALMPVLKTADTFNQSMSKYAELVAVVRGILKVQASTKNEDLKSRRDDFIRDNLKMENNGAGVIVTDNKYDYTPIQDKQTPLPQGQLQYIKTEIYDYLGTNEAIVQNKATPEQEDDFYEGEIKPFYMQLEQAFTNCFFTRKERGFGNEVVAEGNKLQYAKLSDKLAAVKYLSEIGGLMLDQALATLGFPPIGGEEGKRRVQTLNMVNAAKADEYQLGDKGKEKTPPEDEDGEKDELVLRGTPIVFDTPTVICELDGVQYKEVIARGALDGCDMSDFIFNRNHGENDSTVYARTRNKSLDYSVSDRGLEIAAHLDNEDERHRNLYRDVQKCRVDKMSFSFVVRECSYDRETHTRTITKIKKLYDVSAVDFPAYNETSIVASRGFFSEEHEKEFKALEERRLRERLIALSQC